jgi:hypothetical protein
VTVGAVIQGVNELSVERIPLLEKEGNIARFQFIHTLIDRACSLYSNRFKPSVSFPA